MQRKVARSLAALISLFTGLAWAQSGVGNGQWPSYAGDLRNVLYSPLDQINASNFHNLEIAWRFKTDNLGNRPEFKLEGTPLMVNGVVYATAGSRRSAPAVRFQTPAASPFPRE